ncbi:MAG: hypothetical protein FWG36_10355 [Oscillospiraceae bacterium]|nr:hypothetical protein [Oscillospiraceae bacterium]
MNILLSALNEYVRVLAAAAVIVSVVMAVAPKGAMRTVIGAVSGLVIIACLLNPLLRLTKNSNFGNFFEINQREVQYDEIIISEYSNMLKTLIADKTSAYILAKAQALDVDCEVIVTLDDSSPPAPLTVIIYANGPRDIPFQSEMSAFLAFECGVAKENQTFYWDD